LALSPVEAGVISALPTLITAASIHLLVMTFEKVKARAPEGGTPVVPDTVEEIQEQWASDAPVVEPMPDPVIEMPEVSSPSAGQFPGGEAGGPPPVALKGAANFAAMAQRAQTASAREFWMNAATAAKNGGY
jgi:hypothetical protein